MRFKSLLFILFVSINYVLLGQHSITNLATPYNQNFNSLANSGTTSSVLPTNWQINVSATPMEYRIDNGNSNTGSIYSYGLKDSTDRALGSISSGGASAQNIMYGMSFKNETSSNIQTLSISYVGEMWRLGSTNVDTLYFAYSTDASALTNGSWTNVTALYFVTPDTTGSFSSRNGNLPANRKNVSSTINLNIPPNSTFWIKWYDKNGAGSDDGLAVDDLTVSYSGVTLPACTTPTNNVTGVSLTSTITEIDAAFTKATSSQKTLVVYSLNNTLGANPINGTSYSVGQSIGSGTVLYNGSDVSKNIHVTGLTENTNYTFFFFPLNDSCSSGPVYKTSSIVSQTIKTKSAPVTTSYYNTVNTSVGCEDFLNELKNRIRNGHTPILYTQIAQEFAKTDVQDGFIIDRYSTCTYPFTTDLNCANATECDCYNRDHVVPHSWFGEGDTYPMYSDMHHIFPSDGYVNSAKKSNLPLGIVNGSGFYSNGAGVKVGSSSAANGYTGHVFEPGDQYKGDFARTYLYFVTRYHDSIAVFKSRYAASQFTTSNYTGLQPWLVNILVQWSEQDPPSTLEILRNDSVYAIQGNRNPYVDHPEWVAKVFAGTCDIPEPCQKPDTIPTNITFTNVTKNSISGKFTKAIGADGYVIIYRKGSTFMPQLKDSVTYTANQLVTYTLGTYTDSARVLKIAVGNDTTFTLSGLDSSSMYSFAVIPYNTCDGVNLYLNLFKNNVNRDDTTTLGTPLPDCDDPDQLPENLVLGNITENSISGSFTSSVGGADGYLVVYRKGRFFMPEIKDKVNYSLGELITSTTGSTIDSAYVGAILGANDSTFTISGLKSKARYFIAVIPFNNCTDGRYYRSLYINGVNKDDTVTLASTCDDPAQAPENITLTTVSSSSISGTFSASVGGADGYIVIYRKGKSFLPTIADGVSHTVGDLITSTSGSITDSAYVGAILDSNQTSFTISGLEASSKYYIAVIPFNICSGGNFYRSVFITNINKKDTTTSNLTGIKLNKQTAFKIYPNPVTNYILSIQFDANLAKDASLRIVDMLGKVMHQEQLKSFTNHHQIDVSKYSKGMYYLQIGENETISTVPFLKQ